jgi:histone H4
MNSFAPPKYWTPPSRTSVINDPSRAIVINDQARTSVINDPSRATLPNTAFNRSRPRAMTRHRSILRDPLQGITKPDLRRLARRGGVKRISNSSYTEIRDGLKNFLSTIMRQAITYAEYAKRKTITPRDIIYALKREGRPLYGFDTSVRPNVTSKVKRSNQVSRVSKFQRPPTPRITGIQTRIQNRHIRYGDEDDEDDDDDDYDQVDPVETDLLERIMTRAVDPLDVSSLQVRISRFTTAKGSIGKGLFLSTSSTSLPAHTYIAAFKGQIVDPPNNKTNAHFRSTLRVRGTDSLYQADDDCLASFANQASTDLIDTQSSICADGTYTVQHRYENAQPARNNCRIYDLTSNVMDPFLVLITIAPIHPDQEFLVSYDCENTNLDLTPEEVANDTSDAVGLCLQTKPVDDTQPTILAESSNSESDNESDQQSDDTDDDDVDDDLTVQGTLPTKPVDDTQPTILAESSNSESDNESVTSRVIATVLDEYENQTDTPTETKYPLDRGLSKVLSKKRQ